MKIFYFRRSRIFASIACVAVLAAVAVVSSISPAEEAAAMTGGDIKPIYSVETKEKRSRSALTLRGEPIRRPGSWIFWISTM